MFTNLFDSEIYVVKLALFGSPDNQYRKGDTDIFKNPKIIELSKIFLDGIERESIRHPIGHLLESLSSHWLKLKCFSSPTPSHRHIIKIKVCST